MIVALVKKMNTISVKKRRCFSAFLYLTISKHGQIMAGKIGCFCKF